MIRHVAAFAVSITSTPLVAQVFPLPAPETPRIQSVEWRSGETIVLTALPETTLTVMLDPGETISRATLAGNYGWDVAISSEADSFQVKPQAGTEPARLSVQTNLRTYDFALEANQGLQAAYLVRLTYSSPDQAIETVPSSETSDFDWTYRLRGDRSVRPTSVRDNGIKTVIEYEPSQALPAVFAIGPTGDEEVVDGHMRDGRFVIDRVHERLVFRIDKEKATARRNKRKDSRR